MSPENELTWVTQVIVDRFWFEILQFSIINDQINVKINQFNLVESWKWL